MQAGSPAIMRNVNTSLDYLNWVASPLQFDFRYAVGGFEAANTAPGDAFVQPATQVAGAGAGNWNADPAIDPVTGTPEFTLDAEFTAATNNQVTNSDILVLRSSIPQVKPVYTTLDALTGAGILNVTGSTGFQVGQIAAVSDCTKSAAFQISAIAGGAPAVISFGGGIGPPGNAQASLTRPFVAGAVVQPLTTYVYYIGIGQDGDAALRRLDLNGANGPATFTDEELVPDVRKHAGALRRRHHGRAERDRVRHRRCGHGLRLGGECAGRAAAASPPQTGQALTPAPQVYNLLGTQVTAPVDSRKRRVFTVTIALRNQLN